MSLSSSFHEAFQAFQTQTNASLEFAATEDQLIPLSAEINSQQRALNESIGSLPAYDVSRYQEKLHELAQLLAAKREAIKPKSKFSFKSVRTQRPVTVAPVAQKADEPAAKSVEMTVPGMLTLSRMQDVKIDVESHPALVDAAVIVLENVQNCTIDLSRPAGSFRSITLRDMKACTLNELEATTSMFLERCKDIQLTGIAQQWRIHDCHDCTIRYICQTGRPVIEGCTNLGFFNMTKESETMVDDFSDLSGSRRNCHVLQE